MKQTAVEWLVEQYEKAFTLKVNNVMTSTIEQAKQMEREQTATNCNQLEISDENAYTNGYLHGYNAAIAELPKEISDEDIEKFADEELGTIRTDFDFGVIQGMKWYREQLKQKQ